MGIHMGIIVEKQITDEKKWYHAMEDVRESFENEDYFKEYPGIEYNQVTKDQLKMLEITEPLNFCPRGQGFCQVLNWKTFKSLVSYEDRNLPVREALLQNWTTLKKKKNRSSFEQDDLDSVITALSTYDGLDPDSQELVKKSEAWGADPPSLFEFCVGEHPQLPILGRHFRNCSSKIGGLRGKAEEVIRRLHGILDAHFSGHTKLWSDIWEDHYDGKYCKSVYQEKEDMNQMYKKMEVLVGITNVEETNNARKALAGIGGDEGASGEVLQNKAKEPTTSSKEKESNICFRCRSPAVSTKLSKCCGCHKAHYCSRDCQERDWARHRDYC